MAGHNQGRAGMKLTYNVESFTGVQAQHLQGLFSTAYGGLNSYNDKAAFQLALWELVRETGSTMNVTDGRLSVASSDAAR